MTVGLLYNSIYLAHKYINFLNTEDLNGFVEFCLALQLKEVERIKILADERDKVLEIYTEE